MTSNRRIMHIDLDAFFVAVEQVLQPWLRGKPVVVGGKPQHRGVVAAASYEARGYGLHSGMPLITAARLCPQAIFIQGSFPRYREASHRFMAILADFSPYLEPAGLDEAYLDVTGFESIHGSIHHMAVAIKQRVRQELGLAASVGIAGSKVVAKVASAHSKPDGLLEVAPGDDGSFLAPLPISALPGVGKKTESILHGLGIATIGELAVTPVTALKGRLGAFGEVLQRLAGGNDDREVLPPAAAKSISRETTLAQDSRDREKLAATLRYLTERVGARLRQQGRQVRSVTLKLRYADFTTITRRHPLSPATSTDQDIFDAGSRLLAATLAREMRAVRLIGIGVSGLVESGQQLGMLDQSARRREQLDRVIDRIRKQYGFAAIQTGQTLRLQDIITQVG